MNLTVSSSLAKKQPHLMSAKNRWGPQCLRVERTRISGRAGWAKPMLIHAAKRATINVREVFMMNVIVDNLADAINLADWICLGGLIDDE